MRDIPNILIVDDTIENLFFIENVIKNLKINIIQAMSGFDALEKVKAKELALAIIDVRMPGMDGYELAFKLNDKRTKSRVPIIFVTANHYTKIEEYKGYTSGAVDYIYKPFSGIILLSKVNIFLDLYIQKQTIIEQFKLQSLLMDTSTAFINVTIGEMEHTINSSLSKIAKFVKADRSYIFEYNQNKRVCTNTFEWCADGNYSQINKLQATSFDLIKDWIELHNKGEFIYINDVNTLNETDSARKIINLQEVKSLITIPMMSNEKCYGFIGFDSIHHHHIYTTDEQKLLAVFSSMMGNLYVRKQVEETLIVSEEKYRTIVNASPDGIFLINLKGIIVEVSEIGLELFGCNTKSELLGKHIMQFIPKDEKATVKKIANSTMNEGLSQNVELKIKKINQSLFLSEISSTLIQNHDRIPISFMIIVRDISYRKKMETKQIHADRMASLGEMAVGIAHEINQPLNIISLLLDKILFDIAKNENLSNEYLKLKSNKIFDNITRIRNIIDHIMAFSRNHSDYIFIPFDINVSIKNAISIIKEQFKHLGIILNLQLDNQISQILGNTYHFEQVIINMLINAKDAVIERKNKEKEYKEMIIGVKTYQESQFVIVEITDNGIGIINEDINNITLPFFTTKAEGKGTGLGLSICYQIIKEMGGVIEITSDSLNGTKLKIILDTQNKK